MHRLTSTVSRAVFIGMVWAAAAQLASAQERGVSCLGRLEPGEGVIRLAGPSGAGGVIADLRVRVGEWVEPKQIVALLDDHALRRADVKRLDAELANAKREAARVNRLSKSSATSAQRVDEADLAVLVARALLDAARAQLELSTVRAPLRAQVLEVHAHPGERIGPDGIVELGETERMYAVAEVYETDIARVKVGQRARVRSPALAQPLLGAVERLGLKVSRMDVLGTDPIAKADARVIEVRVRLDDSEAARGLTHLQVEVEIEP